MMLSHEHCDPEHTRRGAWRGAMSGLGIIHGFANSWGPFQVLDKDQPGLEYLLHLRAFFTDIVPFERLRPVAGLAHRNDSRQGYQPLTLATSDQEIVVIYLPTGGDITVDLDRKGYSGQWFDPRTGELIGSGMPAGVAFAPPEQPQGGNPEDWVLVLRRDDRVGYVIEAEMLPGIAGCQR